MYCPKCGTPNKEEARFCVNCGNAMPVSAQPPVNPQPAAPQQPPVYAQPPVYQQPPVYAQPPVYPAPVPPQPHAAKPPKAKLPGMGQGIASMAVGIFSLVFFCIWYLALPGSIVGLALGSVANKKAKEVDRKNGMATAGIVCSSIALGLVLLFIILILVAGVGIGEFYGDIYGGYYY